MGLIKKIFGGIFALLGGILKIFGVGKKGEYYLELDESNPPAPEPAKAESQKAAKKAEAPAPQPAMATATQEQAPPEKAAPPEPRVLSQATASGNPVVSKPVTEKKSAAPAVTNFATDYLVNPRTNNSPRRRPGPSVSPFKEMVREMNRKSPSMS